MTNVEKRIQESCRRRYEYAYSSVRAAIMGDLDLAAFWGARAETEEETLELFCRFRDLLDENRPAPAILPESN